MKKRRAKKKKISTEQMAAELMKHPVVIRKLKVYQKLKATNFN